MTDTFAFKNLLNSVHFIQEGFEDIVPSNANSIGEALGALLALGYSEKEAESALKKVNRQESVENIIKECLRVLMG